MKTSMHKMIAVHNSKFKLALHSWYEPMEKLHELNKENLRVITPKIGEKVFGKMITKFTQNGGKNINKSNAIQQ